MSHRDLALFRHFPALELPWVSLGDYPTALSELGAPRWLSGGPPLFVKREDLSSPHYGGNKVRTLEAHMGRAIAMGAREFWATGAYGSNHAIASVTHARRVGLEPGAMLWPQPPTDAAHANLRALLAERPFVHPLASVATLPWGMNRLPKRSRAPVYMMTPGGATIDGAIAHVSAALELAEQLQESGAPSPHAIVLAVGSTCTCAGLLAGVHLAAELGIGFRDRVPLVHAVRVTPWPITSRTRIARFATKTLGAVAKLTGFANRAEFRRLHAGLRVDKRFLGRGYGRPNRSGRAAIATMATVRGPQLDVVYSAKSAAAFFDLARARLGPLLFWATKSTAPLREPVVADVRLAPASWRTWLEAKQL